MLSDNTDRRPLYRLLQTNEAERIRFSARFRTYHGDAAHSCVMHDPPGSGIECGEPGENMMTWAGDSDTYPVCDRHKEKILIHGLTTKKQRREAEIEELERLWRL